MVRDRSVAKVGQPGVLDKVPVGRMVVGLLELVLGGLHLHGGMDVLYDLLRALSRVLRYTFC